MTLTSSKLQTYFNFMSLLIRVFSCSDIITNIFSKLTKSKHKYLEFCGEYKFLKLDLGPMQSIETIPLFDQWSLTIGKPLISHW